jgi:hypothetical protein
VIVPIADGKDADLDGVLNLNRVAAFVWEQLDGRRSGAGVVDAVVARFDVDRERASADYLDLVGALLDLGAVVASGESAEPPRR